MSNRTFRENSGVLFTNDYRSSPNHPAYRGRFNVGEDLIRYLMQAGPGAEVEISAWEKQNDDGNLWYSLEVQVPYNLRGGGQGGGGRPRQQNRRGGPQTPRGSGQGNWGGGQRGPARAPQRPNMGQQTPSQGNWGGQRRQGPPQDDQQPPSWQSGPDWSNSEPSWEEPDTGVPFDDDIPF